MVQRLLLSSTLIVLQLGQSSASTRFICPPPTPCAAPPQGCNYVAPKPDTNGCIIGCGKLVCDPNDTCPLFPCPAPPPNCSYGQPDYDFSTGCPTSCGPLECGCPSPPLCALPPVLDGCTFIPPEPDENGCILGCGSLFCCPDLVCMAPEPGCSYGPRTFDDKGCPTSCGKLECQPVCPICENPCSRVRCAAKTKCVVIQPRKKKNRKGCQVCATQARCVRRRPYLRL